MFLIGEMKESNIYVKTNSFLTNVTCIHSETDIIVPSYLVLLVNLSNAGDLGSVSNALSK